MRGLFMGRREPSAARDDGKDWAEREAACISRNFKVVRVGLSMSITVLLLLAFSLCYVRAGEAAYYASLMALAADALLFGGLLLLARHTAGRYRRWEQERR